MTYNATENKAKFISMMQNYKDRNINFIYNPSGQTSGSVTFSVNYQKYSIITTDAQTGLHTVSVPSSSADDHYTANFQIMDAVFGVELAQSVLANVIYMFNIYRYRDSE